ncbi:uncharacterized protein K452DRAFT_297910 [Aplosporella prunicola CBS 121167]|uniref:Uncharacterized protein n=1 Tax=Aplosporella prunicola CBS 121167 TaxID=1176127 RepID=A0A6A6BIK4_9PEZI|nr:uncharacterized protein K452DRAFT_297910 [Aplosporella prunicola CBS 121167]KAF2142657.1 hypothetical protein K452DRAFT_297910 [Aplosporella prunicola CBS 121167]
MDCNTLDAKPSSASGSADNLNMLASPHRAGENAQPAQETPRPPRNRFDTSLPGPDPSSIRSFASPQLPGAPRRATSTVHNPRDAATPSKRQRRRMKKTLEELRTIGCSHACHTSKRYRFRDPYKIFNRQGTFLMYADGCKEPLMQSFMGRCCHCEELVMFEAKNNKKCPACKEHQWCFSCRFTTEWPNPLPSFQGLSLSNKGDEVEEAADNKEVEKAGGDPMVIDA